MEKIKRYKSLFKESSFFNPRRGYSDSIRIRFEWDDYEKVYNIVARILGHGYEKEVWGFDDFPDPDNENYGHIHISEEWFYENENNERKVDLLLKKLDQANLYNFWMGN